MPGLTFRITAREGIYDIYDLGETSATDAPASITSVRESHEGRDCGVFVVNGTKLHVIGRSDCYNVLMGLRGHTLILEQISEGGDNELFRDTGNRCLIGRDEPAQYESGGFRPQFGNFTITRDASGRYCVVREAGTDCNAIDTYINW